MRNRKKEKGRARETNWKKEKDEWHPHLESDDIWTDDKAVCSFASVFRVLDSRPFISFPSLLVSLSSGYIKDLPSYLMPKFNSFSPSLVFVTSRCHHVSNLGLEKKMKDGKRNIERKRGWNEEAFIFSFISPCSSSCSDSHYITLTERVKVTREGGWKEKDPFHFLLLIPSAPFFPLSLSLYQGKNRRQKGEREKFSLLPSSHHMSHRSPDVNIKLKPGWRDIWFSPFSFPFLLPLLSGSGFFFFCKIFQH